MTEAWVTIGAVRSVNPARREVRVSADSAHAHEFESMTWLRVAWAGEEPMRCRVAQVEDTPGGPVITLAPGVTREMVSRMRGGAVVMASSELHEAPADALPTGGLTGFQVVEADGTALGVIAEVYATGMNAAILVEKSGGGTMLLPLIDAVVLDIDWDNEVLTVGGIEPYVVDDAEEPPAGDF
jgi:16S rRNA processing protein RimM